jgi:Asp-tRNA(Asn)/Glu-tRNA(Gln) amidotransferase A subunit family amidase
LDFEMHDEKSDGLELIRSHSLAAIAKALRSGHMDLIGYVEEMCRRGAQIGPRVEALLPEPERLERLSAEAGELQARFPNPEERPPLYGVLVAVKDIFHVSGFVTRAGTEVPPHLFAGSEAAIVSRLRDAGALILGKSVTTEFAYFEPGPTRNPHNPAHTPGGSSSGSAAAVASGLCALALGTQTIGSVGLPGSLRSGACRNPCHRRSQHEPALDAQRPAGGQPAGRSREKRTAAFIAVHRPLRSR